MRTETITCDRCEADIPRGRSAYWTRQCDSVIEPASELCVACDAAIVGYLNNPDAKIVLLFSSRF